MALLTKDLLEEEYRYKGFFKLEVGLEIKQTYNIEKLKIMYIERALDKFLLDNQNNFKHKIDIIKQNNSSNKQYY